MNFLFPLASGGKITFAAAALLGKIDTGIAASSCAGKQSTGLLAVLLHGINGLNAVLPEENV